MTDSVTLSLADALALCKAAAIRAGAREETAKSLAQAAIAAEAERNTAVGMEHFTDYLEALREGRLDGKALPELSRPLPAVILADAKGGSAHLGFDLAFDQLATAAKA